MRDIQNVIDVAQQAAQPQTIKIGDRTYAKKGELELIAPPLPETLIVNTLQGVVDYVKAHPDGEQDSFVHVKTPQIVLVSGPPDKLSGKRPDWLCAKAAERWRQDYQPGNWFTQEAFILWLFSGFAPSEDHARLLAIVSSLKAEKIVAGTDNGLSQAVAVQSGIKSDFTEIKNPFRLRPYRTFPEIASPLMTFVARVRNGKENEPPQPGLWVADSGQWEIDAIAAIKEWLADELPETTIIG